MMDQKGKSTLLQYISAIIGSLTTAGYGSSISWTSSALPYLTSKHSYLPVSEEQTDIIEFLLPIGYIIGYIINPILIDRLGRKWTLLIFSGPQIFSWLMILLADNIIIIYIARIINGIGYGGGFCAVTVYLSEIGNRKNRGIFITFINLSISMGILFIMLLGTYIPYYYMNISLMIMPFVFVVLFFFMPDSSYFIEQNKKNETEEEIVDLMDLRKMQIREMQKIIKSKKLQERRRKSKIFQFQQSKFWHLFSVQSSRRALIIIFMFATHDVLSGHVALKLCNPKILSYGEYFLTPQNANFMLTTVKLLACFLNTLVIEKVERRSLLLYSGIFAALAQGIISSFFFFVEYKIDVSSIGWVPLFASAFFEFGFSIGMGNMFFILQGEFFLNEVKSYGITVSNMFYTAVNYLFLFQFQVLLENFGSHFTCLFFCISCLIFTFSLFKIIPETRGKSLKEIQIELKTRKSFC